MRLFMSIVVSGSVVITAWHYWKPFFASGRVFKQSEFVGWAIKGFGIPVLFWILINCGVVWSFGPFIPQVSMAKNTGGPWADVLLHYIGTGTIVLASWWLAFSMLWLVCVVVKNVPDENRPDLNTYALFCSLLMLPIAALILYIGGWFAAGFAACAWLLPIAHYSAPLLVKRKALTFYSAAMGRMKLGKFKEAEAEILHQLEQCEDDFDGWLMLAELYAKHFGDVDTADQTIRDLCSQPGLNPGQVYSALNLLAQWHLTLADDPVAARSVLEIVCQAYPGTHLARLAQARMAQVPASRQELLERRQGRRIRLPSLREDPESTPAEVEGVDARSAANECVNRLSANPNDVATREKLARLFAEQLGRADLGIEQTELLLEMADQPASKIAEWLAQIAAWEFKYRRDADAGRKLLERLIHEHPQSPQAFAAQRRLILMDMEARFRRKSGEPKIKI